MNEYERISDDVILVDGVYYKKATDKECVEFIWGKETDDVCPCGDPECDGLCWESIRREDA